jgi:hypothetical protein
VGVLKGVASESLLKTVMASDRLVVIDDVTSEALFQALRDGRIDVAVFSKAVFEEKRYQHEYFDLAVVHTLHDAPRVYGFYFHASPRNQQIVQAFDRYLAVLDVSGAVAEHEDGERQFIQRYVIQRSWHLVVLTAGAGALVLVVVLAALLYRYRRLARLLAASNEHILQQQHAHQQQHHRGTDQHPAFHQAGIAFVVLEADRLRHRRLLVVGVAVEYGPGPVDLLTQQDTHQRMG